MSTAEFIGCSQCRQAIRIGQSGATGYTFYWGETATMEGLTLFLGLHYLCGRENLVFITEHHMILAEDQGHKWEEVLPYAMKKNNDWPEDPGGTAGYK